MSNDWIMRRLPLAAGGVLIVNLVYSAIFVPLFTDETSYTMALYRLWLDDFTTLNNLAACGIDHYTTPVPAYALPVLGALSALHLGMDDPIWYRVLSVSILAAFLAQLAWTLPRIVPSCRGQSVLAFGLTAGFLGLGVLPILLIINRPEIIILMGILVFVSLPLMKPPQEPLTRSAELRRAGLLVLTTVVIFSVHFKQALLLPLFWICTWFALRTITVRFVTILALSVIAVWGASFWQTRLVTCDDPRIASFLFDHFFPVTELLKDPLTLPREILLRFADWSAISPLPYLSNALIKEPYAAEWLYHPINVPALKLGVNYFAIIVFAGLGILTIAHFFYSTWRIVCRRATALDAIIFGLVLGLCALSFVQGTKHYYESRLFVPLLGLTALLCASSLPALSALAKRRAISSFLVGAILSQVAFHILYSPMVPVIARGDVVYDKQHFSLPVFGYEKIRSEVEQVAPMCKIDLSKRNRHLVLDDTTYISLRKNVDTPIHGLFMYYWWFDSQKSRAQTLVPYLPSGFLASCNHLFPEYKGLEQRVGGTCCVSAANMAAAAAAAQ